MVTVETYLHQLSQLLRLDLTAYHPQQMQRLLRSFMQRRHFEKVEDLIAALRRSEELRKELLDSLGINVTSFFRDPAAWTTLEKQVLPMLLQRFRNLSVWSAGCSIGKEPYSLAAVLHHVDPKGMHRIIATDIDSAALQQAREARYPAEDLAEIPQPYRAFFPVQGEVLTVAPALREKVRFERLNLLTDPYPKNIHLLVCRNLLIYFRPEVKPNIFHGFSQSLMPGGVLFLGASEVLFNPSQYGFQMLHFGFYQRV